MLVGNDVVDLADPESSLDALHDRFVERVFTNDERDEIFRDPSPRSSLWRYWAAKESAYKVIRKADPDVIFAHGRFRVDFFNCVGNTRWVGTVEHEGFRVDVDVARAGDIVHAVAMLGQWPAKRRIISDVAHLGTRDDASAAARTALISSVASRLECGSHELEVDGGRPPRLSRLGESVGIDVSLSHHGRFAAFAHTLPVEVSGPTRHHRGRLKDSAVRRPAVSRHQRWR